MSHFNRQAIQPQDQRRHLDRGGAMNAAGTDRERARREARELLAEMLWATAAHARCAADFLSIGDFVGAGSSLERSEMHLKAAFAALSHVKKNIEGGAPDAG